MKNEEYKKYREKRKMELFDDKKVLTVMGMPPWKRALASLNDFGPIIIKGELLSLDDISNRLESLAKDIDLSDPKFQLPEILDRKIYAADSDYSNFGFEERTNKEGKKKYVLIPLAEFDSTA